VSNLFRDLYAEQRAAVHDLERRFAGVPSDPGPEDGKPEAPAVQPAPILDVPQGQMASYAVGPSFNDALRNLLVGLPPERVDPAVLPLARTLLDQNGASRVKLFGGVAAGVRGRFDLVVANILADTLVAEARALDAVTAPGGRLVVSGLLAHQVDRVVAAFPGWRLAATRAEDPWRTLRLEREG